MRDGMELETAGILTLLSPIMKRKTIASPSRNKTKGPHEINLRADANFGDKSPPPLSPRNRRQIVTIPLSKLYSGCLEGRPLGSRTSRLEPASTSQPYLPRCPVNRITHTSGDHPLFQPYSLYYNEIFKVFVNCRTYAPNSPLQDV